MLNCNSLPSSRPPYPSPKCVVIFRTDILAMTGMIFGPPPAFEAVIESVAALQEAINAAQQGNGAAAGRATSALSDRCPCALEMAVEIGGLSS